MTNEEKIFDLITKIYGEMQEGFKELNSKVDKNHAETIARLDRLENNQNAIKEFILNSDDTFKNRKKHIELFRSSKKYFQNNQHGKGVTIWIKA